MTMPRLDGGGRVEPKTVLGLKPPWGSASTYSGDCESLYIYGEKLGDATLCWLGHIPCRYDPVS